MIHGKTLPVYLLLTLFMLVFFLPQRGEGKPFTSPGGDFTVNFPTKPVEGSANKKTFVGTNFVFEKHRVYLVVATSPQGMPVIDKFLTSFSLAVETKDKPAVDI